jgi:hypothetical protein
MINRQHETMVHLILRFNHGPSEGVLMLSEDNKLKKTKVAINQLERS